MLEHHGVPMNRLVIKNVDVLTLDGPPPLGAEVLGRASIVIRDGRIESVSAGPLDPTLPVVDVIDGEGQLALPALFNGHCHAAMTLVRGWAEDLPFPRWLNERIWVAESALTPDDVYWGAALAACEMIRCGTVGFADHYFWMEQTAKVVAQSGMKALLAWCHFGLAPEQEVGGTTLADTVAFARAWHGEADGRIRVALGPHSPYMCAPEVLGQVAEAAAELGVAVHLHLAESREQVDNSLRRHGATPVRHLEKLGLLDLPLLAAHCIAVDDEEIALLAERGVVVAHTPKTYMKLAMGMAPLQAMLDGGVTVALGTDGPASNADLNLLEVLRLVGLLQKWRQGKAEAMPLGQILRLACQGGARAVGFGESGVLRAGAPADILLLSTRGPHWAPGHDPAAGVVYASHPGDVTTVLCDGRPLMLKGRLCTLDEERIVAEATKRGLAQVRRGTDRMRRYKG